MEDNNNFDPLAQNLTWKQKGYHNQEMLTIAKPFKYDKIALVTAADQVIRVTDEGQVFVKNELTRDPAVIGAAFLEWVDANTQAQR